MHEPTNAQKTARLVVYILNCWTIGEATDPHQAKWYGRIASQTILHFPEEAEIPDLWANAITAAQLIARMTNLRIHRAPDAKLPSLEDAIEGLQRFAKASRQESMRDYTAEGDQA